MTTPAGRRAYVGSYVLESLTTGMYDEPRHALREYIQNSYDAIRRARKLKWLRPNEGQVIVRLDERSNTLSITDDGTGISSTVAWEVLSSVGASSKNRRDQAGFRGIGRLAGIAYCEKLRFTTKYRGEATETVVTFDCERFRRGMDPERDAGEDVQMLLTQAIADERRAVPPERVMAHYTRVVLEDLSMAPDELKDVSELLKYLRATSPIAFDPKWPFAARINERARSVGEPLEPISLRLESVPQHEEDEDPTLDQGSDDGDIDDGPQPEEPGDEEAPLVHEIYKAYKISLSTARKPVKVSDVKFIQDDGEVPRWWGWIGQTPLRAALNDEAAGLRVRVRDIQIDGTAITDRLFAEVRSSYSRFNGWYIGEIHVIAPDVIPNARRDGFEENTEWREIQAGLLPVLKDLALRSYKASKGRSIVRKLVKDAQALATEVAERLVATEPMSQTEHAELATQVAELRSALQGEASAELISAEDAEVISAAIGSLNKARRRLEETVAAGSDRISTTASAGEILETVFLVLTDMLSPADYRRIRRIIEDRVRALPRT